MTQRNALIIGASGSIGRTIAAALSNKGFAVALVGRDTAKLDQARAQLARAPRPLPQLKLGDIGSIFDLNADAIAFEGYDPWPAIKAPVAV